MKKQASTQKRTRHERLSDAQVRVLLAGLDQKLVRSSMGWSVDKYTPHSEVVYILSPATIKSLAKKQLIDANFDDPRGFEKCSLLRDVRNLDGARYEHSPEVPKLLVWTNRLGRQALADLGLHPPLT